MKKPKKFTEMQTAYINNRAAGIKQKESAIAAGFSPLTADRQASNMEGREDFKKAIAAARKKLRAAGADIGVNIKADLGVGDDKDVMPKSSYEDSKQFLLDAMNHKGLPIALRADYAKALLPYQHGRVGETGKKQSQKDRAKEIAAGGKANKFAPKAAPGGNVVALRR